MADLATAGGTKFDISVKTSERIVAVTGTLETKAAVHAAVLVTRTPCVLHASIAQPHDFRSSVGRRLNDRRRHLHRLLVVHTGR
ncbi:hypothetical protein BLA6860_03288 [Burkholderia lata]|nr:hypothetical protein BLA6860_03288 [Burkholderia lata]